MVCGIAVCMARGGVPPPLQQSDMNKQTQLIRCNWHGRRSPTENPDLQHIVDDNSVNPVHVIMLS